MIANNFCVGVVAYRDENENCKPIIFWGAWLYFGPSAIGSLWIIGSTLYPVITGEAKARDLVDGLAMMLLATLYGALSIWTLWAVSTRYFRRTP